MKSEEKQLSANGEINPTECELQNELNSSVMNAIMADVATASTVAAGRGGGTSSQCSGNRQEIKIEREDSNNQNLTSSDSGLVVPVSQRGEKERKEKPPSSTGCDGKAGGSRKRKEMEGGRNEWVSRRKARPKRQKVIQRYVLIGFFDSNFVYHLQLAMGLGAVRLSKPTLLEKVCLCSRYPHSIKAHCQKLIIAHISVIIFCSFLCVYSYWHPRFAESRMPSYSASTTSLNRTFLV